MRILIINTDYGAFLRSLYGSDAALVEAPYGAQLRRRNDSLFGGADFYSKNFIAAGHEAWEVHANNAALQSAWLHAHKLNLPRVRSVQPSRLRRLGRRVLGRADPMHPPPASPLRAATPPFDLDLEQTLVEQARFLRPDVILNQSVSEVESRVLQRMRPYSRLIVGQIASPLPDKETYSAYDLMISSLPNFVTYFRKRGVPAELSRLGFEPTVLDRVSTVERDVPLSFVGSITTDHKRRFEFLETLAARTDIAIWGRIDVPADSPIRTRYRGEAWGTDMYGVLARSKITVNQHIDIAESYANNMRLYEATGMGALLVTDWKDNISDLFEPDREVACYRDAEDAVAAIHRYLEHEDQRAEIAAAGHRRTLTQHRYRDRTDELLTLFSDWLASRAR